MAQKNLGRHIRSMFANIVCGCIYNKETRRKVRAVLNSDILGYLRFIRRDMGTAVRSVRAFTGYRGHNLILGINNTYIYKFPLRGRDGVAVSDKEMRVTNALRAASPVPVPGVRILTYRGDAVRRYDYILGVGLRDLDDGALGAGREKIARQVAAFIYHIGRADPADIRDLKPDPDAKPGYMYGWCQGDIYDNFILNPDTLDIIAFIDWEDCYFGSFAQFFAPQRGNPDRGLAQLVRAEYDRLWGANGNT